MTGAGAASARPSMRRLLSLLWFWPRRTAGLAAVRYQLTGVPPSTKKIRELRALARQGITRADYERLGALAVRAVLIGSVTAGGTLAANTTGSARAAEQSAAREVLGWADRLLRSGDRRRLRSVEAWLALFMEQTTRPGCRLVLEQLDGLSSGALPPEAGTLAEWAPAVWAAGMDYREALTRLESGPLDARGLRTLAALRGLSVP